MKQITNSLKNLLSKNLQLVKQELMEMNLSIGYYQESVLLNFLEEIAKKIKEKGKEGLGFMLGNWNITTLPGNTVYIRLVDSRKEASAVTLICYYSNDIIATLKPIKLDKDIRNRKEIHYYKEDLIHKNFFTLMNNFLQFHNNTTKKS